MMVRENIEEPSEIDPVARQIAEDERRRSGAFLRDYLARHRIDLGDVASDADSGHRDADPSGGDTTR